MLGKRKKNAYKKHKETSQIVTNLKKTYKISYASPKTKADMKKCEPKAIEMMKLFFN